MSVNGTLMNYYFHCKRQCYLHGNRLNLEDNSEQVKIGKVIHEEKAADGKNTELAIDNIRLDKLTKEYLTEIKKSDATDILLENESGRLLISKRAIENAVKNVVNNAVKDTKDCKVIVDIDPANYLSVYVSILLNNNLKIRDMTLDLQLKIKSQIKDDFDLDVKQVNIKIDSVEEKENEKKESKKIVEKNETIIESQKAE